MTVPDARAMRWRKSSRSTQGGPECVEVMELPSQVAVRDSKDPEGPVLMAGPSAWRAFVEYVR